MIGRSEWFERRKYGGWGIVPKDWRGGVYIAVFLLSFVLFHIFPIWSVKTRLIVTGIWLLLFFVDIIDIMANMKKDERERMHEAIAERNALWGVIFVLTIGVLYDIISNALQERFYVNPFIAVALVVALLIKSITNIYLEKRN